MTFSIDENGILSVRALEKRTGEQSEIEIKPAQGLDEAAITQMLKASYTFAAVDIQQRQAQEQIIEAERLLDACDSALAEDAGLLDAEELASLHQAMQALNRLLSSQVFNKESLAEASALVHQHSGILAQRRMDQAIQAALKGTAIMDYQTTTQTE